MTGVGSFPSQTLKLEPKHGCKDLPRRRGGCQGKRIIIPTELSFVDLPGLIAGVGQAGHVHDIDLVNASLVISYLKKPVV